MGGTLTDLARSKSELVAENALLRQQLIILCRQIKRPACTKTDRMILVLLARASRAWKQALFIVQAETLHRLCQDFHEQFAHLASTNPQQYFEVFFRHLVESTLFARPAAHAAAQLGIDAFEMVSSSVEEVVVEFIVSLRHVDPALSEAHLQTLARAIRRFCLASIIATSSSDEELRSEFYLLIGGSLQRKNVSLLEISF
jgi:hypothetical protein